MAAQRKVNTATLIRGQLYTFRHPDNRPDNPIDSLRFENGKPVIVEDKEILALLEDIYTETEDGDGEVYEKPLFLIERGVAPPEDEKKQRRHRLSADREVKRRPRKRRA